MSRCIGNPVVEARSNPDSCVRRKIYPLKMIGGCEGTREIGFRAQGREILAEEESVGMDIHLEISLSLASHPQS